MARTTLLAIALLLLGTVQMHTQPAGEPEPTREQLQTQISILLDQVKTLQAANTQATTQAASIDPELRSAYVEAKKKEYQYIAKVMELNIEAFNAQRWSSYAILFLVVVVVISGISFSGFQLWKSISVAGVQTSSELELSAAKVRITSSVVGIVVLTISLAFLYIYALQVYQIRILPPTNFPSVESAEKTNN
jgi:hypothetical protein